VGRVFGSVGEVFSADHSEIEAEEVYRTEARKIRRKTFQRQAFDE
jgi:hypothetical protein